MEHETHKESILATWAFIGLLVFCFIIYSTFTYTFVGDNSQPDWDFRPVRDVPGQSPYAIYETLPHPQHVRGAKGE